jgi:ABC-type amino acid transport substrate-binding protein
MDARGVSATESVRRIGPGVMRLNIAAGFARRRFLQRMFAGITALVPARGHTKPAMRLLHRGELRVGTYFVNPPFEFVDHGTRVGFEIDLADAIARKLQLRPIFVDTRWEIILGQMERNRFDCIIGGITITPSREKVLAWSTPYMVTTLSLIVNARRMPEATDLAGLKTATVGVQAATTDYDAALALYRAGRIAAVKVYPFARIGDAMTDLVAGRIGAVMKVYPVAAYLAKQTPELKIVAQVPADPQPLGIGFNRDNPGLLVAVNGALASLGSDGTYRRLAAKWNLAEQT